MRNVKMILTVAIIVTFIGLIFMNFEYLGNILYFEIGMSLLALIVYFGRIFVDSENKKISYSILSMCIILFNLFLINYLTKRMDELFFIVGFFAIFSIVLGIVMLKNPIKVVKVEEKPQKKQRRKRK